eukprot:TRINITY_DN3352_c1_g1_i1.p1 TRINITY_DN3352_c1_g1~~TRINITY_DN3352_c1_g1_i1.p1  ORF type:complete len:105 (+),score=7.22 TRINITY_DN3352_c1_g1_i1:30-317(+)
MTAEVSTDLLNAARNTDSLVDILDRCRKSQGLQDPASCMLRSRPTSCVRSLCPVPISKPCLVIIDNGNIAVTNSTNGKKRLLTNQLVYSNKTYTF